MANYVLKFPVFSYGRKGEKRMLFPFFSLKDLSLSTFSLFKQKHYENKEIIDSAGFVYYVKDAVFVKYLHWWYKYLPLSDDFKLVFVDYVYEDKVKQIHISDFKKLIIPLIKQSFDIWEESYGVVDELITLIDKSSSFEEIAELLK